MLKHFTQLTGLLTDRDHLDRHPREKTGLLHGRSQKLPLTNTFLDLIDMPGASRIIHQAAGNIQRVQNGHTAVHQDRHLRGKALNDDQAVDIADRRQTEEQVFLMPAPDRGLKIFPEQKDPQDDRADDLEKIHFNKFKRPHQHLGDQGQLDTHTVENIFKPGPDKQREKRHRSHTDKKEHHRIHHRRDDRRTEFGLLFQIKRQAVEHLRHSPGCLTHLHQTDPELIKIFGVFGQRHRKRLPLLDLIGDLTQDTVKFAALHLVQNDLQGAQKRHPGLEHRYQLTRKGDLVG